MINKKRFFGFVMILLLLVNVNIHLIGADDVKSDTEEENIFSEGEKSGDLAGNFEENSMDISEGENLNVEVDSIVGENVLTEEKVLGEEESQEEIVDEDENKSEEFTYIDIEEINSENESGKVVLDLVDLVNNSEESLINSSSNKSERVFVNGSLENGTGENFKEEENNFEEINLFEKKVKKSLVNEGRVEVEFEALESEDIEITKKEMMLNEFEKRVRISSEDHFEDELKVYSDLPIEAKEEDINLYWENEEEEVTQGIIYYDEDGNDLIERISWKVPHLSTQYYLIQIVVESSGNSSEMSIKVLSPENGKPIQNPVNFDVRINYTNLSVVKCNLTIIGEEIKFSFDLFGEEGSNITKDLDDGVYDWELYCEDGGDSNINDSESGIFKVENLFEMTLLEDYFFKGSSVSVGVAAKGGIVELNLIKPGESQKTFLGNVNVSEESSFTINANKLSKAGVYTLSAISHYYERPLETEITKNFSVNDFSASFDSLIKLGDEIGIEIKTNSEIAGTYDLKIGDNEVNGEFNAGFGNTKTVKYNPSVEGSYPVLLFIDVDGKDYSFNGGSFSVESSKDTSEPEIDLQFPSWKEEVENTSITFEYDVSDNIYVQNCSFKLYNTTKPNSGVYEPDTLLFPLNSNDEKLTIKKNIGKEASIKVSLVEFDEGDYIWEVGCFDNSSNEGWDFNYFSVNLDENSTVKLSSDKGDNYTRRGEVEDMIEKVNKFLEEKEGYGIEEKEVLEMLGVGEDMNFYKKQLIQIDQDMKFNLRFMEDGKRITRIEEIYKELDEMKEKIVLNVKVEENYEYTKNSLDVDIEVLILDYTKSTNTNIKKGALKSLVEANKELQNNLKSTIKVKQVKVEYFKRGKNIVLVSKSVDFEEDADVLEIIPEGTLESVNFISAAEKINKEIYKVKSEDFIKDYGIVYYFDGSFSLKEIEKTDSVLFSEKGAGGKNSPSITGFFSDVGEGILSFSSFFFFIAAMFTGYVGFFVFMKVRLESWKKEPSVVSILEFMEDAGRAIRKNDVEGARSAYNKMKGIYKVLPRKCKSFFYKEIKKIRLMIDKRDIMNLVKEYEDAKDNFRKDDAIMIHGKINQIYKKLPKKYQERIYERLVKREV